MADLERRIKAAQALAGFDSLDDLAAAIGREGQGLSRKTLRRIASETDPRQAKDYELGWIAGACGVPLSFLLEGPTPVADEHIDRLEDRIAELAGQIERVLQALSGQGRAGGPVPDRIPDLPRPAEAQEPGA